MLSSYLRRHGLAVGLSFIVLFKLWLVHTEDIYASATEYDALWYVTSAKNWYWATPFSWTAFVRPPSYPLFIALVHLTGIPLRLAIELLQLSAYLVIIHALGKIAVSNRVCLLLFAAMALHPASFQFNNYTMSDCFYAAILPLTVGGLLLLLFTGKIKHALWTGAALGVLWNAREESFLIPLMLAVFVALAVWQQRVRLASWKDGARVWLNSGREVCGVGLNLVGEMMAVLATIIVGENTTNSRTFESCAKSHLSSAPYKKFYNALPRISPDSPQHYLNRKNTLLNSNNMS